MLWQQGILAGVLMGAVAGILEWLLYRGSKKD